MAAGDVDARITTNKTLACAVFDGTNDNITKTGCYVTKNFSMCAWFLTNSSGTQQIVCQRSNATNTGMDIYSGVGFVEGRAGTGVAVHLACSYNAWHFVCLTYDGNNLNLYLDGTATTNAVGDMDTTSAEPFSIGYRSATTTQWFRGSIRGVRLYSRVLTSAEIVLLYAGGNVIGEQELYYPLTSDYNDYSGKARNATNSGTYLSATDGRVAVAVSAQRVLTSATGKFMISRGAEGQVYSVGITEA